jgi:hypothetical protein
LCDGAEIFKADGDRYEGGLPGTHGRTWLAVVHFGGLELMSGLERGNAGLVAWATILSLILLGGGFAIYATSSL